MIRRAWETKWGIPSRGEPRFEAVPLVDHLIDLGLVARQDAEPDDELERLRRRAAAGLDPFEDN